LPKGERVASTLLNRASRKDDVAERKNDMKCRRGIRAVHGEVRGVGTSDY